MGFRTHCGTAGAATGLLGLALAATVHRGFLIMPGFAAGTMLVHALNGWYPFLRLFRRLSEHIAETRPRMGRGARPQAKEISREKYALKTMRGDFDTVDIGR